VELYRGFTVINFNNYIKFLVNKYLALHSVDTQKSQTLRHPIYRL